MNENNEKFVLADSFYSIHIKRMVVIAQEELNKAKANTSTTAQKLASAVITLATFKSMEIAVKFWQKKYGLEVMNQHMADSVKSQFPEQMPRHYCHSSDMDLFMLTYKIMRVLFALEATNSKKLIIYQQWKIEKISFKYWYERTNHNDYLKMCNIINYQIRDEISDNDLNVEPVMRVVNRMKTEADPMKALYESIFTMNVYNYRGLPANTPAERKSVLHY